MPSSTLGPAEPGAWTFFRLWLANPRSLAAVAPSSRRLAARMVAALPAGTRRVVELGAGTGVFTRALLEHGIRPEDLLVVELHEDLHRHLQERFPGVRVERADARDLVAVTERTGFRAAGEVHAVVSGLGMLAMSPEVQRSILEASLACLAPGGRFVQFTYGLTSPVSRPVVQGLGLVVRRERFTWRNVPPATIFTYARPDARPDARPAAGPGAGLAGRREGAQLAEEARVEGLDEPRIRAV
jgi:phospholipid N-methyltransferase